MTTARSELRPRLLALCRDLAAGSTDGVFSLPIEATASELGATETLTGAAVRAIAVAGELVRVAKAHRKEPAKYILAGTPPPAMPEPGTKQCSVCGWRYTPAALADGCPGFMSHAAVRVAARRLA